MNRPSRYGASEQLSDSTLLELWRRMLRIRLFEERVWDMTHKSQMPQGGHLAIGQEAEIVGACMALRGDDYMTGNHRSHGHPIGKGAPLGPLMAELFGKRTGICRGKGGSMHLAAFSCGSLGESGIVGSLMPVAVGAGLSAELRGSGQVCLCFFGDGAANCGPFHEAINLAAVWNLPVIFLCENNGYAVCTPQSQVTKITDIAQRASAYAIPGIVVDGQDVLAVYDVVHDAAARARSHGGPTLIEAKTYRYKEHQEFPGLTMPYYRPAEELDAWQSRDPIEQFGEWLQAVRQIQTDSLTSIKSDVESEVDASVAFARESPPPHPSELFEDVLA